MFRLPGCIYVKLYTFQNMFLAIINDTYSEVKSENVSSDIHIGTYIQAKWNQMTENLPFLKKRQSKMREKRSEKFNLDNEVDNRNTDRNNG